MTAAPGAAFTVLPAAPLMDDRLAITVTGLPPGRQIAVRAMAQARDGREWRSEALFDSGPEGAIDLGSQAPAGGTYSGADAMGLFWSMRPQAGPGNGAFFNAGNWSAPVVVRLEAVDGGRVAAAASVERRFARPDVRRTVVAEGGIAGLLYEPGDGARHPGVIVLGGSEGGYGWPEDALLASRGFTVLSLAYFRAPGLPPLLRNIPVEYFGRAIAWMSAHPAVVPESVGLLGFSRGAEAALQAAAAFPEVRAVAALAPAHARWPGLTSGRWPRGAAWTEGGRPLPYAPIRIGPRFALGYVAARLARRPVETAPLFAGKVAEEAEIAVERIRGPVLLVSGGDDRVWPAAAMAERVMARLARHRHPYPDEHLHYPEAGHWLPRAWLPMAGARRGMRWAIGGTPEGAARAHAEAWPRILRLLAGCVG